MSAIPYIDDLWDAVKFRRNVHACSMQLRPRIRDGVEYRDEKVFRVYVMEKLPTEALRIQDMIPRELLGMPTDIVRLPEMRILPPILSHVERIRPVVAGISIGNWAITAGTNGYFFEKDGIEALGSNAHVFAEDALEDGSVEKRIVQPGRYDGGLISTDIVAEYLWHQQLYGGISGCPIATGTAGIFNSLAALTRTRTRLLPIVSGKNYIDFAVAEPKVLCEPEIIGATSFDKFIGLGFAGSEEASYICKAARIEETGWTPMGKSSASASIGDLLRKVGRTTEQTEASVRDDVVRGVVNYGSQMFVEFDDLLLTEKLLEGGDSGSSVWKEMQWK